MARVEDTLLRLRKAGRRAILIVDPACGDGALLLRAARRAETLGFVAIEALGFDRDFRRLALARPVAERRLSIDFRPGEPTERDFDGEADLVLGGNRS
jgi:SAM-dependent methyltransferase